MKQNNHTGRNVTVITLAAFLFSCGVFWFSSLNFPKNSNILYWPMLFKCQLWLHLLAFALSNVVIGFWLMKSGNQWSKLKLIFNISTGVFFLFVWAYAFFVAIFNLQGISHIGTVQFQEKTYHLARVAQFDRESKLFLGVCDSIKYWCKFHQIYQVHIAAENIYSEIGSNLQSVQIYLYGEAIYSFDGVQERCISREHGYCRFR